MSCAQLQEIGLLSENQFVHKIIEWKILTIYYCDDLKSIDKLEVREKLFLNTSGVV
jgi:hypothetical protein